MFEDSQVPVLPAEFDEVFIFGAPEATRSNIEQAYDARVERIQGELWKLAQRR